MYLKPKVKAPSPEIVGTTEKILQRYGTNTICMVSVCPNRSECFARGTATFMILGSICTRKCHFCNVEHGKPLPPDPKEPQRVAEAVRELGLRYVVITSVDRDDLPDFGAGAFAKVCEALENVKVELLTPDFQGKEEIAQIVIEARPYKLAHNVETVQRLTKSVMPGSNYKRSLKLLELYAKSDILTKSSVIVGMGETKEELMATFKDLASVGVRQLTIGQYLRPTPSHLPVAKYYTPQEFEELAQMAYEAGLERVVSGALVRSSYYADIL